MARLSLAALEAWGEGFGRALRAPHLVTLAGDLGAGKTTLVRAICRGYGVTDPVTSPTFALVHTYGGGRTPVHHADLYRLRHPAELLQLGWDELLSADAILLVEWPERAAGALPPGGTRLTLSHVPGEPDVRALVVDG